MDLTIGDLDGEQIAILHRNCETLFTYKWMYTNQSPVSGFHRLRINLCNLLLRQVGAVLTFQPTVFLDLTDCGIVLNLTDTHKLGIGKLHAFHIRDKLSCSIRYFHIAQCECRVCSRIYTTLFYAFVDSVFYGIFSTFCRIFVPGIIRVRITNDTQHFYKICK